MPDRANFDTLLDQYDRYRMPADPDELQQPSDLVDFYNQYMSPEAKAQSRAVAGSIDDPNKAAKDLNLATQTGQDPSLVSADPEAATRAYKAQQASHFVGQNTNLQSYVNNNAKAASVSNDDWGNLNELGKVAQANGFSQVLGWGVFPNDPQLAQQLLMHQPLAMFTTGLYGLIKQFGEAFYDRPPEKMSEEQFFTWNRQNQQREIDLGIAFFLMTIGDMPAPGRQLSSAAELKDFLDRTGASPVETRGQMWRREIDEFLASREMPTKHPTFEVRPDEIRPEGEMQTEIAGLLPAPRPSTVTEQMVRAGQVPPAGIDPVMDVLHKAIIKHDLQAFDNVFEMVQNSNTYKRSPEMMEKYLQTIMKDMNVGITRDAVDAMYKNTTPAPGDGLLGYERGLADKIATARMSGADIKIPMASFLAYTDPALYTQIRDDFRIRPDGLTNNEARELETLDPETIPKTLLGAIRKSFYFQPMFMDNRPTNIPTGMYTKYFNKIVAEGQARLDKIWKAAERDVKREMTPEWRGNEKRMTQEVQMDMRYDPGFRADRYLRMGEFPNGQKTQKLRLLQPQLERFIKAGQASTELRQYAHPKGTSLDTVASLLDFKSGAEMINALNKFHRTKGDLQPGEFFDQRVKEETARRMKARYGDLPTKIYNETRDRALGEEQFDVFIDELYMINEAGEMGEMRPITKENLRDWAHERIQKTRAHEVDYENYRRAAEKAGRNALDKALSKKWGESFKAKLEQAISTNMAKMAIAAEKRADKMQALVNRYSYNKTVDKVSQEYTNYIHSIFDQVGIPQPRTTSDLVASLKGITLPQFIEAKRALGWDLSVDIDLITHEGYPFSEYTVQERDNFYDSILALDRIGRAENLIQAGAKVMDFNVAKQQALDELAKMPQNVPLRHPSMLQNAKSRLWDIDASLIKPEQRLDWYDRNDPRGIFNKTVFMPLSAAKHVKNDLLRELGGMIRKLPKLDQRITEKLENTTLIDWRSGDPRDMNIGDLIGVMLHMGNPSNFAKLTGEFRVGTGPNSYMFRWDPDHVKAFVKANATKDMWDFVQGVWDIYEHYWPKMEELARDTSGVAPPKIEAREIETGFGRYKGGYVPLRADPFWLGPAGDAEKIFGMDRWFRSTPPRNWEHVRTDAKYPLDINYLAVVRTMEQMLHDLAFRQPLKDAWRFVSDPDIKKAIQNAWGQEDEAQLEPWLRYISNGKVMDDQALAGWNYVAHLARERVTSVQLLYRLSTIAKHTTAAAINSAAEVGMGKMGWNSMRIWMSPDGPRMRREINAMSGEMRNRAHDLDRDIGEMYNRALKEGSWMASVKLFGGAGVAALDKASAYPTWWTVYEDAYLKQGLDKQEAIFLADKAVRQAHGSSGITDLPAIQRGGEWQRLSTVAYSFFSHNFNRVRNTYQESRFAIQDFRAGREEEARAKATAKAFRRLWGQAIKFILYTTVTGAAVDAIREGFKKDEESATDALWRMTATGTTQELMGTVPWLRELAYPITHSQYTPMGTPYAEILEQVAKVMPDAYKEFFGQDTRRTPVGTYITALGYVTGWPGMGQLAASAQYYTDVGQGIQRGDTIWEKARGYTFGKSHPDEPLRIPRGRGGRHR